MSLRACVLGVLSVVAFGCEGERVLGDIEDAAGQGGDESGGTANGGSSGSSVGGSTSGTANGGTAQGGTTPNGGTANGGTSPNGGSGGGVPCFSPDNGVPPTFSNLVGCPCTAEDVDQCVAVGTNPLSLLGMVCDDDLHWKLVEDGPCEPGPEPWCMLDNRVFKKGSQVPLGFLCDVCWFCDIDEPACLLIDCAPPECPENTTHDSRCRSCGLRPGGCDIVVHGCFGACSDGDACEFGTCWDGVCSVGPCI